MFSRKSRYFFVRSKKTFSNSACSLAARLRLLEYGDVAMLKQPMIEKLLAMRLHGMDRVTEIAGTRPGGSRTEFPGTLGLLVDQRWDWRENQAPGRRLKNAKLRTNACVEEIDYLTNESSYVSDFRYGRRRWSGASLPWPPAQHR